MCLLGYTLGGRAPTEVRTSAAGRASSRDTVRRAVRARLSAAAASTSPAAVTNNCAIFIEHAVARWRTHRCHAMTAATRSAEGAIAALVWLAVRETYPPESTS